MQHASTAAAPLPITRHDAQHVPPRVLRRRPRLHPRQRRRRRLSLVERRRGRRRRHDLPHAHLDRRIGVHVVVVEMEAVSRRTVVANARPLAARLTPRKLSLDDGAGECAPPFATPCASALWTFSCTLSSPSSSAPPAARRSLTCLWFLGSSNRSSVCRVISSNSTFTNPKLSCRNTVANVAAVGTFALSPHFWSVNVIHRTMLTGSTMAEYATGYLERTSGTV